MIPMPLRVLEISDHNANGLGGKWILVRVSKTVSLTLSFQLRKRRNRKRVGETSSALTGLAKGFRAELSAADNDLLLAFSYGRAIGKFNSSFDGYSFLAFILRQKRRRGL